MYKSFKVLIRNYINTYSLINCYASCTSDVQLTSLKFDLSVKQKYLRSNLQ